MTRHAPATPADDAWRDLGRISFRRSIVLSAAAAVIGLLVAGAGLFSAKGTSTFIVPPEDVALVNQQPIARSDFLAQLRSLYAEDPSQATPAQRRKVLDDMVREELFVQRGKELDVASVDPDVRTAMVAAVEQSVAADAMVSQPHEEDLQAYYSAHRDRYASEGTIALRDLVFPTADAAARAAQALRSGGAPDAILAADGGRDTQSVHGEEFYFAAKIHLGDALFAAASRLPVGGVSAPIPQPDGVHVLVVTANTPPVVRSYASARDEVLNDYRNAAIARLETKSAAFLRKRANILIAKDLR
ncbi:MAG: peptidyl-prolyl cis-trans isomerase [Caulobacteraceae bacterium]|nr:peptidyl-prolyl cis-trans isomerase [Caulobacteraceae bacterium]